jgi:hypothetical protein
MIFFWKFTAEKKVKIPKCFSFKSLKAVTEVWNHRPICVGGWGRGRAALLVGEEKEHLLPLV